MSCLPGMPCYENTVAVYTTYPPGCTPSVTIDSNNVIYTGPNLPCSGISHNECLTVALQKLDSKVCPAQIVEAFFSIVETDPVALARLCDLIATCTPS